MDIYVWVLCGGFLGWIGCRFLGFSEQQGLVMPVIIGALGGFVGGWLIAPLYDGAAAAPGAFNASGVVFAVATATVFIVVGNVVYKRWGR